MDASEQTIEFLLNNPTVTHGAQVVHTLDGSEQCNRDAMGRDRTKVDAATARKLVERGQAVPCKHCKPDLVAG